MKHYTGDNNVALEACDTALDLDYVAIARHFDVCRSTLSRRHRGVTRPREQFLSESIQRLNNNQEKILLDTINRYTERNIPPTAQMVTNFAEEILQSSVGKNWTSQFVYRHRKALKSVYLRNIDKERVKSEYLPSYEYYFELVSYLSLLYLLSLSYSPYIKIYC